MPIYDACAEGMTHYPTSRIVYGGQNRRRILQSLYARDAVLLGTGEWVVYCYLCGNIMRKNSWVGTIDHVVPRSLGGSDFITNLRLVHPRCNQIKGQSVIDRSSSQDMIETGKGNSYVEQEILAIADSAGVG